MTTFEIPAGAQTEIDEAVQADLESHALAAVDQVPVEELAAGDRVLIGRLTGFRPVIRVDTFKGHAGDPDADSLVVIYRPAGPGLAWENRARAHGVSHYPRDEASLACKPRGALVTRSLTPEPQQSETRKPRPRRGWQGGQERTMLQILEDGEWHTSAELEEAGIGRPNSRAAALRDKGYAITCAHVPGTGGADGYRYRLDDQLTMGRAR